MKYWLWFDKIADRLWPLAKRLMASWSAIRKQLGKEYRYGR
jgi:hypothetical protein